MAWLAANGPRTSPGAEYRTTKYAKMGDLGSKVLKKMPTGVVWKAGALAEVSFYIKTNHGGGYQFRLCPLEEELTEACFQRTPLAFSGLSSLRWDGPSSPGRPFRAPRHARRVLLNASGGQPRATLSRCREHM